MNKEELVEKAKNGRVDFNGNVEVSQIWDGNRWEPYYAQYADKYGIHACPEGQENYIDDFEPYGFEEVYLAGVFEKLIGDIVE